MRTLIGRLARGALAIALCAAAPALAGAQTGGIAGTVSDPAGEPVGGAQLVVIGTNHGALSGTEGAFTITGVPVGTWSVRVTRIGHQQTTIPNVTVRSNGTARLDVTLETAAVQLGGVVVSASRKAERITEAPATITKIDADKIELSFGNSFSGALKEVKGLDYIQVGATTAAINARGFNSSFNNRMLMVEDNRISVLPESGLPVGVFTAIPKLDLASLEVIVGPGAALYGPDASNGVLSVQTKDPLEYPGTTVEVSAGVLDKDEGTDGNSYGDIQFRHADVIGNFGYKITGEWQEVDDFENRLTYVSGGTEFPEIGVNFHNQVQRASGAVVYYAGLNRFELSGGWSQTDGVGQTNVGRNQFEDWSYNFVQFEASTPNLYFNLYRNQSRSGQSYAINRFSVNRGLPAFEGMTDRQVKLESDWPSNGRLFAAELQHNFDVEPIATEVTWGGQFRRDVVSSDREWLTDRLTGDDVEVDQFGVYGQTQTALHPKLDLVLAARVDEHDNYDTQFSPKAGLIFKPAESQAVRFTYNRAFKSPTILQTNFWIPDFVPFVGVFGNTEGFTIRGADGSVLGQFEPLEPEKNNTFELGYKGVLAKKFFLDVTGYHAEYENFFSPLTIIANPFNPAGPSFASFTGESAPIQGETGNPQILLTYFNLGEATINGVDMGLNYMASEHVTLNGTFSWIDLDSKEVSPDLLGGEEATALNAPETKFTLGADWRDVGPVLGGATLRYVNGYEFLSGINQGHIPTFTTLDLTVGYEIESIGAQVNLAVNNLFTCRGDNPDVDGDTSSCGFDEKHLEMVNMPEIGTVFFIGFRVHR